MSITPFKPILFTSIAIAACSAAVGGYYLFEDIKEKPKIKKEEEE